jgi:hypothetical protein
MAPVYGVPAMRFAYGAPFAAAPEQEGPLPGWGPPNPVELPMLVPLRGHPYVWARSAPNAPGTWDIDCQCKACGATEGRDCEFPPKSGSWIARFAAKHCHDRVACQQAWEHEYHTGLHRLRQAYPSAP